MNDVAVKEISSFVANIFDEDSISVTELDSPKAVEIKVKTANSGFPFVSIRCDWRIVLQIGKLGNDDYVFEYDDYQESNIIEVKRWLQAVADNKLREESRRFLGVTFNKKLVVN